MPVKPKQIIISGGGHLVQAHAIELSKMFLEKVHLLTQEERNALTRAIEVANASPSVICFPGEITREQQERLLEQWAEAFKDEEPG